MGKNEANSNRERPEKSMNIALITVKVIKTKGSLRSCLFYEKLMET